jgi:hypothetical protein
MNYCNCRKSVDSDWLCAERPRGRNSSPGRVKNFHFSISSRPFLGPAQSPFQCVPGALSLEVMLPELEADYSFPIYAKVRKC